MATTKKTVAKKKRRTHYRVRRHHWPLEHRQYWDWCELVLGLVRQGKTPTEAVQTADEAMKLIEARRPKNLD